VEAVVAAKNTFKARLFEAQKRIDVLEEELRILSETQMMSVINDPKYIRMERKLDAALFDREDSIERAVGIRTATLMDQKNKLLHENMQLRLQIKSITGHKSFLQKMWEKTGV
jgi:hypothetical protein